MDKTTFETIINTQKEVWNKFSNGWKKWDELTMDFCKPDTDEMINMLGLKDTDTVLDVAGGTGEPGLTIAQIVKKEGLLLLTSRRGCYLLPEKR